MQLAAFSYINVPKLSYVYCSPANVQISLEPDAGGSHLRISHTEILQSDPTDHYQAGICDS